MGYTTTVYPCYLYFCYLHACTSMCICCAPRCVCLCVWYVVHNSNSNSTFIILPDSR